MKEERREGERSGERREGRGREKEGRREGERSEERREGGGRGRG